MSQDAISSPGTRTTRLASSSARLGMTDRGPSDPADSNNARRIWGPKCFRRVSAIGSSGEGNRVVASSATWSQREGQHETHKEARGGGEREALVRCETHDPERHVRLDDVGG